VKSRQDWKCDTFKLKVVTKEALKWLKGICHVHTCLNSTLCPVTSLMTVFLYSVSWSHMIMLSCSANHLCVCHQCISGITGWFVCAIISSISVPAHRTHSLYSSSTHSYTVYCSRVPLSLSLTCCSRAILSPSFSTRSTVSSFPWYLICVLIIWISPISGKKCSGIGKWIFLVLITTVQSITVCDGSKAARYCVTTLLECHELWPFRKLTVTHVLCTE